MTKYSSTARTARPAPEADELRDDGPDYNAGYPDEPPPPTGPEDYGSVGGNGLDERTEQQTALKITYFSECNQVANKCWLIKGVLAANETSTLIGPPGSGKSALGTEIAVAYTHDTEWRGHRIKERGGVCYFAFERADLVRRRLNAHRLRDNLPSDLPIAVIGRILDLMDPHCVDLILPTLKEAERHFGCPVRIAVFDTYNKGIAIGGGDEDKARDQNRALGHLRQLQELYPGLHVMAIGHTGKDEGRGARGSNALLGDTDIQNQISAAEDIKIVTTTKGNDVPLGELVRFRLDPFVSGTDEDGDPISVHIVAPEIIAAQAGRKPDKASRKGPGQGVYELRDAIVHVLDGQAESIHTDDGRKVKAVAVKKVEVEFNKRYVVSESGNDDEDEKTTRRRVKDAKRKAFNRALNHMPKDFIGRVVGDQQWIWKIT